jgi:DNA-binding LacI/PurR family transcriptional regulator
VDGIVAVSVGGIGTNAGPPPIVYVDQPDRTGHVLLFDGRGAGYSATRHLREHGHERIGIVTAPLSWPNVREVYEGYIQAVGEADGRLVAEVGEFTVDAGRAGLEGLLELPDPPSAVFAAGETLAMGVLHEAKSRGIDVPADLAITGYTDSPAAALVEPPLTMVLGSFSGDRNPSHANARRAHTWKETPYPSQVLDVELVVRQSCGSH